MTDWQPIETAPKDGTVVLIIAKIWDGMYYKPQFHQEIKIAKYSTFDGYWRASELGAQNLNLSPKWWMPLPDMPE